MRSMILQLSSSSAKQDEPDIHQDAIFSYLVPEARVSKDHPLRTLRQVVNRALRELSQDFQAMNSREGRPSIPTGKLLRALLLQALYTIRSRMAASPPWRCAGS